MNIEPRDETSALREEAELLRQYAEVRPEDFGITLPTAEQLMFRAEATERRSRGRRRVLVASVATAAAAVVVAAVSWRWISTDDVRVADPAPTPSVQPSPTHFTNAGQVLRAASVASLTAPDPSEASYWRVESLQRLAEGDVHREIWLGNGKPGVLIEDGEVLRLPAATFGLYRSTLSWSELVELPTDPTRLGELLGNEAGELGRDRVWYQFSLAGQLLAETPAPPAVRAGLWRMLAGLEGVTFDDQLRRSEAGSGYTISIHVDGHQDVSYVVDPTSGRLLQATYGPPRDGTPGWSVVYLSWGAEENAPVPTSL